MGAKLKQVVQRKPSLHQRIPQEKPTYINLAFLRRHKISKETRLDEGEETDSEADDGRRNLPRGKAAAVELMKRARAHKREAEEHVGASGPMSDAP